MNSIGELESYQGQNWLQKNKIIAINTQAKPVMASSFNINRTFAEIKTKQTWILKLGN